jgi:glycosyltransferase involved in cell wall biosynthesis
MENLHPYVSVIIPTYNRASLLERSIRSVLSQTFQNYEIIVVDDASVDNTDEVVSTFGDPRIRYLKHETNRGGSAARNTGIKAAKGKFIAFQDSDDEWLPDKLEKQVKILVHSPPIVGVVYTGFWRIQGDRKEYIPGPEIQVKEGNIYRELLRENFVTTQAVLVKKACLAKVGQFDETLPRLQDWELFLRIAKHFEFRYVPEPLVHSFFTEGSISSQPKALTMALEIILEKNLEEYKKDQKLYAAKLLGLADQYRFDNDINKSRKYLIDAFKVNYRPGLFVAIMASFLGISFFNYYWNMMHKIQD